MDKQKSIMDVLLKLDAIHERLFEAKQIFTSDEAAKFLDIQKSYLFKLTSAGIIPFSKPNGKKIYFAKEDLVKWALTNRCGGNDERELQAASYCAINKR